MIAILTLAVALSGQDPAPTATTSPETIAAIRQVLDDGLVDYPSARFREVRLVIRPSNQHVTLAVCGNYNSRTRAGGYGGWSRFVLLDDRIYEGEGDTLGRRAWSVWCEGDDVVVLNPDITAAVAPGQE